MKIKEIDDMRKIAGQEIAAFKWYNYNKNISVSPQSKLNQKANNLTSQGSSTNDFQKLKPLNIKQNSQIMKITQKGFNQNDLLMQHKYDTAYQHVMQNERGELSGLIPKEAMKNISTLDGLKTSNFQHGREIANESYAIPNQKTKQTKNVDSFLQNDASIARITQYTGQKIPQRTFYKNINLHNIESYTVENKKSVKNLNETQQPTQSQSAYENQELASFRKQNANETVYNQNQILITDSLQRNAQQQQFMKTISNPPSQFTNTKISSLQKTKQKQNEQSRSPLFNDIRYYENIQIQKTHKISHANSEKEISSPLKQFNEYTNDMIKYSNENDELVNNDLMNNHMHYFKLANQITDNKYQKAFSQNFYKNKKSSPILISKKQNSQLSQQKMVKINSHIGQNSFDFSKSILDSQHHSNIKVPRQQSQMHTENQIQFPILDNQISILAGPSQQSIHKPVYYKYKQKREMQQIASKIAAKSQIYAMNVYNPPIILNKQTQEQSITAHTQSQMLKTLFSNQKKQSFDIIQNQAPIIDFQSYRSFTNRHTSEKQIMANQNEYNQINFSQNLFNSYKNKLGQNSSEKRVEKQINDYGYQKNEIGMKEIYDVLNQSSLTLYKALGVRSNTIVKAQIIEKQQKEKYVSNQKKQKKGILTNNHPMKGINNPHIKMYKEELVERKQKIEEAIEDQIDYYSNLQSLNMDDNLLESENGSQNDKSEQIKDNMNFSFKLNQNKTNEQSKQKKKKDIADLSIEQQTILPDLNPAEHYLKKLKTLDQIDFQLKQKIQGGCNNCQIRRGQDQSNYAQQDPKMFDFVVQYRSALKNSTAKKKDDTQFKIPNQLSIEEKIKLIEQQKEKVRRENFPSWKIEMEKNYAIFLKQLEIAQRPKYIKIFEKARDLHLFKYKEDLNIMTLIEQSIRESVDRQEKGVTEFRKNLRLLLAQENLNYDDFIKDLIIIQKAEERQTKFFQDVKDLKFAYKKDKLLDILNDRAETLEDDYKTIDQDSDNQAEINEYQEQFIDQLLNERNKQNFLQVQKKDIFNAQFLDPTYNQRIEFAKQSHLNMGLANSSLIVNRERSKIDYGKYVIIDQILLPEQSQSLVLSLKSSFETVKQLYFCNNYLTCKQFNQILSQLSEQQIEEIESIVFIGQNELGGDSLRTLIDLYLNKRGPYTLTEIKLVNVKIINSSIFQNMLEALSGEFKLQTLSLSKLNLDFRQISEIINFLSKAPHSLKSLDLSYNQLQQQSLKDLYASLILNRNLQSLNISFNPVSRNYDLKELTQFIHANQTSLQHLDLSGVLQTALQVMKVIKKISKSQSLLSVHLSNTDVIDSDLVFQDYILKKLRIQNDYVFKEQDQKREINQYKISDQDIEQLKKYELLLKSKQMVRELEYFRKQNYINESLDRNSIFIVQRTVAHPEIKENCQWIISRESCFICERWQYTIFLHRFPQNQIVQNDVYLEGNFELLYNNQTNKQQTKIKLIDIRNFARSIIEETHDISKNSEKFLEIIGEQYAGREQNEEILSNLRQREEEQDLSVYQESLPNGQLLFQCIIEERIRTKSIQYLPYITEYNDFNQICEELDNKLDPNIFAFSGYVRPSHLCKWLKVSEKIHRFIPQVRVTSLPIHVIKLQGKDDLKLAFNKDKSVFKNWQKDTPQILSQALKNDLGYWRAQRVVKDPSEFRLCQNIIERNFEPLKHIFVNLISGENYPHIGTNDFLSFCKKVEILDETMPSSYVEIAWSGLLSGNRPAGPGNTLFRHEFLEMFIRIANAKYRDSGRVKSSSEALEFLLQQCIPKFHLRPWQEFRDVNLWQKDVDALLKTNFNTLQKIHSNLFPRSNSSDTGLKNCIELLSKLSNLQMSGQEVRFCFGMSKMTVKDEIGNLAEYDKLRFPEFLEFLGRIAHGKFYEDRYLPLAPKIQRVLISIFQPYGIRFREPEQIKEDDSSSEESISEFKDVIQIPKKK